MGSVCLSLKQLLADPRFRKLQEMFPERKPVVLKACLQYYRSNYGMDDDWFPDDEFKAAFGTFLHNSDRRAKLENSKKLTSSKNALSNYKAVLSAFTHAQLEDAIDYLVDEFGEYLDTVAEEHPDSSRAKLLKEAGGFETIMGYVIQDLQEETVDDIYQNLLQPLEQQEGELSEARKAELYQVAEGIHTERNTILDYKEHLIARAASRIGEREGIKFEYSGMLTDWKNAGMEQTASDDEESAKREEGVSKGSRFVDFRERDLASTLSPRVKRFLGGLPMYQSNGMPYVNVFGKTRMMDYQQAALPLFRVLECVEPHDMMRAIQDGAKFYPWMSELYDQLEEHPEMKPVIYTTFSRVTKRYISEYVDNDEYRVGVMNSGSKDYSVVRHMLTNMMEGNYLDSKYMVYNGDGRIVKTLDYKKVDEDLSVLRQMLAGVEMRLDRKPTNPYGKHEYEKRIGVDSVEAFLSEYQDVVPRIVEYARGVGLDVDADDIAQVLRSEMPNTSKDFPSYHNRAELLVAAIKGVYKMAGKGKYADADGLSNFLEKEMKMVNFAMARAVYDEVEQRTRLGKKTISALDNPNLTHIEADILTNRKGLSDEGYRESLDKEWLQYEGYTLRKEALRGDDVVVENVPVGFLGKLYASPRLAQQVQLVQSLEFNGVEYAKMNDGQKALSSFVAWDDKNGTHFQLPMAADYGSSYDFLKVPQEMLRDLKTGRDATEEEKKTYNSSIVPIYQADIDKYNVDAPIVKAFAEEVMLELQRMDSIEERMSDDSRIKLSTYETNGMTFTVFPEFNETDLREKYLTMPPAKFYDHLMLEVAKQLQKIVDRDIAKLDSLGVYRNKYAKYFEEYTDTSRGWPEQKYRLTPYYKGRFQEFSLQQYYAAIQIDRIFTGGFVHFPNLFEYEKRCMFRHAPHTALYMEGDQNIVYVDDDTTASAYVSELTELVEALYNEGRIDEAQRDEMIRQYESIKDTDGQGVRTIPSYLKLLEGMGVEDYDKYRDAWNRIRAGKPTKDDINMFLFTTNKLVGAGFEHIPAADGALQKPVKNPVFHKYSEIVLLAPELMKYCMQARSAYMEGFSRAARELKNKYKFDVDLFLFKSNVKLGFHSGLSPLATKKNESGEMVREHPTAASIQRYLVDKIKSDPDRYLHKIPWKYYGKAATMPTDIVDTNISMPSQSVKAVWSNLTGANDGTETLHLHDRKMEAVDGRDLYYETQAADVIDAYREVEDLLEDKAQLEKLFQEEIASRSYSTDDMMYALSLLENGNFSIPLCSPTVAKQVQEMLFSIINKRMTRPKVKGAHVAIYSAVGIDRSAVPFAETDMLPSQDLLGIKFEGKGENRRIVGLGCILPVFDSRLDIFTDKNGMITPKRMKELIDDGTFPEELFHFYGLRTPTDDLHSVLPLIANALTARVAGAGLGMSKEAMAMDGHDNDGDEEHCYFRDFDIVWHEGKIRDLYRTRKDLSTPGLSTYVSEDEFVGWFTEDALDNKESRKELLSKISDDEHRVHLNDLKRVELVQYDYSKSALENTKRQRDAGRKELLRAQLTSIEGSRRLIIPTNNTKTDIQAKTTAIVKAVNQRGDETLLYKLMQRARDIEQDAKANGLDVKINIDEDNLYRSISSQPLDVVNKLYEVVSGGQSPYSFTYTIEAFRRVMGGASLIDVFALYSSAHRLLQSADLYYIEHTKKSGERIPVTFFGTHRINKLCPTQIYSDDKTDRRFATTTNDAYLQSSVDNTKNPILGLLNVSQELSEMISFLSATGISEERMNMILPQPVMEELVRRLGDHDSHGFTEEAGNIIKDLLGYQEDILDAKHKYQAISRFATYLEDDYIDQIPMSYQQLKYGGTPSQKQMAADLLYVLIHLNPDAALLSDVVRTTRPEATTATVGPNIARTSVKLDRLNTLREKIHDPDNPVHIGGLDALLDRIDQNAVTDEQLFEATKGPAQYARALNSLMYDKVMGWMERYFPQARKSWYELATGLAKRYTYRTLQEGTVQQIFFDMLTWKMMHNTEFMGDIESRREDLVVELPKRLKAMKDRIRSARRAIKSGGQPTDEVAGKLVDNVFLDHLGSQTIDGFKRIKFYAGGPVTGRLQGKISSDWADLVTSEDEEVRQLGIDLYMYNFITNGTRFGMYEFAHFAPLTVLWSVPGLVNAMETALSSDFDHGSVDTRRFVHQYYMNHWQDNRLVPIIEMSELPNGIREKFGLNTVVDDRKQKTVPFDKICGYHYILVRQKNIDPESSNTKKTQYITKLYRVQVSKDGVNLVERPKLGRKGKHGQMTIQYNPYMSETDIRPMGELKQQENASLAAAIQAQQRWGNTPSLRSDVGADVPGNTPPSLREEAGLPAISSDKPSLRADLGIASPADKDMSKPASLRELVVAKTRQDAMAEKASKNNEEILNGIPEETPGAFAEPVVEFEDNDDIDDTSYNLNDGYRAEYVQSLDDETAVDGTVEDVSGIDNAPALYNTLDGLDEIPQEEYDDEANAKMPHLEIATREGALVKTRNVLITPDSVRDARRQKAYVELNRRLRKILQDNGIAVGAITTAEARMAMSGVADFGSAKVTAEGLKELIRIADGVRGEEALPEEFAHMALEMLGHRHPLVERLLNELQRNDEGLREVFGGSYDAYLEYYKDDMDMMRLEAAGKLVAKELLYQQEVRTSGLRGLIHRIVEAIKTLLRKIGIRQVDDAILDAEGVASQLARDLLSGRLADEISLENVVSDARMADIRRDITKDNDILSKMLKIEMKRLQVLKRRLAYRKDEKSHESVVATEQQIARLENSIKNKKTENAIYSYISNAIDFLNASEKSLDQVIAAGMPANSVCRKLRVTQDVIYSYRLALKNIKEAIDNKELEDNETLRAVRDKFNGILNELMDKTDRISMQYFQGTLREFYGTDGLTITAGKERGRHISIEEMATKGDRDISIISRWVHSMGDCNDLVLKMIDGFVKKAKYAARRNTDKIQNEISVAFADLVRKTGSRDQSFMFARNPETGKKTGEYITEEASKKLSPAQKEFYDRIMRLKKGVDKLLPESKVSDLKIVMLRKTALDKAREANDLGDKGKYLWESIRNTVMDTSESIDYDHYEVEKDFEGNRVDKLPILYTTKGKKESYDDMTDDVATSILAYAGMANEYYQMNNIIGEIENARYMSSRRQITQRAGSKLQRETVEKDDGLGFYQDFTVPQIRTNIQLVLEDFLQMHVYGHLRRNEGTFGRTKISKRKTVDTLNAITSYSQLAINLPQRIANVTVGGANIVIQAAEKGMFNMKDLAWATKVYTEHTANRLLDTGAIDSNDKLSLFNEYFDVSQDNGRRFKNAKYGRSRVARVMNTNLLYSGLMIGEDYLASTTALALARNYKVKGPDGKTYNLWDAYEVKYKDETNKTGAYLSLKEGFTKMNGMSITQEDEQRFTNKVAAVNFELQGIYNQDDKSAIQSTCLGALVMMYRKWMAPALKRRYGATHYDHLKEKYEEGYWRTTGRYLMDSIQSIINEGEGMIGSWTMNFNKLTDYEKSNLRKALRESAILIGVVFSIALLEKLPPDDDDSKFLTWADQMLLYQLYRLRNEIGSQAPTHLFVKETLRLFESPFAAVEPVKNMLELYKLLLPSSYFTEVKNGPYKGHSRAYKYIWDLPPLCLAKHWQRFKDPSSMINFYRNDMK